MFQLGVPWLRRLLVVLSLQRPGFSLSPKHMRLVVDKLIWGLILLFVLQFLLLITFHQCCMHIYSCSTELYNLCNLQQCYLTRLCKTKMVTNCKSRPIFNWSTLIEFKNIYISNTQFKLLITVAQSEVKFSCYIMQFIGASTPHFFQYISVQQKHTCCKWYKINSHLVIQDLWWKCNCVETSDKCRL